MKTGVLLKYNKVHNNSLYILEPKLVRYFNILWADLSIFESKADKLDYNDIKKYFSSLDKFDFIIIGDVFWETGQSICRYGEEYNIPVFFLQHGQWIYIKNKKNLKYYPAYTFLFGDNVARMCSGWNYGKKSHIITTGSPRYDSAVPGKGSYVYFSPPVIEEIIHRKPSGVFRSSFYKNLEVIRRIDKELFILIQPHYREARIDDLHELFPYAQFVDPQLDALKLIHGSTKVLTSRNSTVVLDAIAYQKQIVLIDLPDYDRCFFERGYFEDFALESTTKMNILDNLLSDIKTIKSYIDMSKKHIYLGDSTKRIVDKIKEEV